MHGETKRISAFLVFIIKKFVAIHGHMDVKYEASVCNQGNVASPSRPETFFKYAFLKRNAY